MQRHNRPPPILLQTLIHVLLAQRDSHATPNDQTLLRVYATQNSPDPLSWSILALLRLVGCDNLSVIPRLSTVYS